MLRRFKIVLRKVPTLYMFHYHVRAARGISQSCESSRRQGVKGGRDQGEDRELTGFFGGVCGEDPAALPHAARFLSLELVAHACSSDTYPLSAVERLM